MLKALGDGGYGENSTRAESFTSDAPESLSHYNRFAVATPCSATLHASSLPLV